MRCKHCGIGLEYYANPQHSGRKSCMESTSGYHYFVTNIFYLVYTVYRSCRKKPKDADYPMQTCLRDPNSDTG